MDATHGPSERGQQGWYAPTARDDERGSMLIVALGILALLSILGLTFARLMTLESAASTNYVDGVRARLIAEGGLRRALTQLKLDVSSKPYSSVDESWVYAGGEYGLPLELSTHLRPGSQEERDALANGQSLAQIERRRASFAAVLARTYHDQNGIDQYKIKVIDTQTQFNLNSRYEESQVGNETYDLNYIRFLDALGVALSKKPLPGTTTPSGRNPILHARYPRGARNAYRGGMAIYQFRRSRENGEFKSKTELLEVLESEEDYELLKDYVTAKSWVDRRVVSPVQIPNQSKKPWADVKVIEPRSPINVNLASKEVIAANLAGIAGRAIFFYSGDWATRSQRLQEVDEGTSYHYVPPGNADIKEEKEYQAKGVVVYFDPIGYKGSGPGAADPPDIDGAYRLAGLIWQHVQTNPFRSYAEWEAWLDQTLTPAVLNWTDSNGRKVFPDPNATDLVMTDLNGTPLSQAEKQQIKSDPRFVGWFHQCVRDLIKANCNPNARLSSWNPDPVVSLNVDKGGLLYMDPRRPDSDPNKEMRMRQTNEFCFAPKGVFEVTALGEVLGSTPVDVNEQKDENGDGLTDRTIFAQAKVRAVVKLFETVSHRTQRDFEQFGGPNAFGGYLEDREEIETYPVPKIYWDPRAHGLAGQDLANFYKSWSSSRAPGNLTPSKKYGYLQLKTLVQPSTRRTDSTAVVDMAVLNDSTPPHFELLLQDRRVELPGQARNTNLDVLEADTSGKQWNNPSPGSPVNGRVRNRWGFPYLDAAPATNNFGHIWGGSAPMDGEELWQTLVLTPDGYLNTALRPSNLWYRASDSGARAGGNKEVFLTGAGQDTVSGGITFFAGLDPRRRGASNLDINPTGATPPGPGNPDEGGNVAPVLKGGVSFWYKPEFDWAARDVNGNYINDTTPGKKKMDQRFCGLLGVSHVLRNDHAFSDASGTPGSWCRGTQMFVTRNTSGDLRITRLYYEVCGAPPDFNVSSQVTPPYNGVEEQPWVADPVNGGFMPISVYWNKCRTDQQYTWPPKELLDNYSNPNSPWRKIAHARIDWWVPRERLQHWRKGEWHHIAIRWDDDAGDLKVWLDTEDVTGALRKNPVGDPYKPVGGYDPTSTPPGAIIPPPGFGPTDLVPAFVRLNAKAGGDNDERAQPKDMISVGSIWRDQNQRAGLFKYSREANLPANGTIDDVRFFDGLGGSNSISFTGHYEREGAWRNEFDLTPYFPPDSRRLALGSISFTGYLPTAYSTRSGDGGAQNLARQPNGAGQITLTFQVYDKDGNLKYDFSTPSGPAHWEAIMGAITGPTTKTGFQLVDDQGEPVVVELGDRLVYDIVIDAAKYQPGQGLKAGYYPGGFAVASPVVDSVDLTFMLPNPEILFSERVN